MSSEEADNNAPTYAVVGKKIKKNHSVIEKESDISDSNIPTYALVDKNKNSSLSPKTTKYYADSTYDVISLENLHSSPNEDQESVSGDVTEKKDEVKKPLSESLHDKKFLCLLVAIIVIMVTSCACFLLAFLQISELRSETAAVQDVSINKLYLQLDNTTQYIENETRRSETSVRMLYNWLLSENVTQQVNNSSSLQLSEMFESEIRMLILDILENPGQYHYYPVASCATVLFFAPSSPSGLYWVRSSNGSAVHVYCDMTRLCGNTIGGWMKVIELDMTDNSTQCPSDLRLNDNNLRTCGINSSDTLSRSSTTFNLSGIRYSSVHGMIRAYGCGSPDGFNAYGGYGRSTTPNISSNYVDGISLTYGLIPRQHIWTFAVRKSNTDCIPPSSLQIENDYFCGNINSGSNSGNINSLTTHNRIQWNRGTCESQSQCCSPNNPMKFYKQLPQPTTDDIEMRLCRDESATNENIFIDMIDIFVQ